jgi:hypothetical protein
MVGVALPEQCDTRCSTAPFFWRHISDVGLRSGHMRMKVTLCVAATLGFRFFGGKIKATWTVTEIVERMYP